MCLHLYLFIPFSFLFLCPCSPSPHPGLLPCFSRAAVPFPLSASSVSACPAWTLPLDMLLFSFSLHGKGFPPSLPLFPSMRGGVETNARGSWLYWLDEEALSLWEKFPPHPTPNAQRGPCFMVLRRLQANGRLWGSAASLGCCQWGFRSGKLAARRGP